MSDKPINPELREALQKRDIDDLRREIIEGFKGVHERQDTTNGKVLKNTTDINELKTYNQVRMVENRYNKLIWWLCTSAIALVVALASYIIYNRA